MSYQQIFIVGNVGSEVELRYTPSGVAVCNFSLATNKNYTNSEGERATKTTWFRVSAWRKTAEIVSQHVTKGQQVLVVGEMDEARPWTDKDGNVKASLEVTAQNVTFLGKQDRVEPGPAAQTNEAVAEEDIPF